MPLQGNHFNQTIYLNETKLISKTDSLLAIAESKLNGKINSANNYASEHSLYEKINGTILYFDSNNHNVSYTKTDNCINGMDDSMNVKIVFYIDDIVV